MRGGGNGRVVSPDCWSVREMQGYCLLFPAEAGFHDQFLPIVLLKRKIAVTFAALWCDR